MKKSIALLAATLTAGLMSVNAFGAEGIIRDGRTLVPVRGVFEELGLTVDWNAETETASVSNDEYILNIPKGDTSIYRLSANASGTISGSVIDLDVPQTIINDRFYIPLRAVSESFGADVSWDGETQTVTVKQIS